MECVRLVRVCRSPVGWWVGRVGSQPCSVCLGLGRGAERRIVRLREPVADDVGVGDASQGSGVRLSELLAALSLGTDLGMGHPMEHVLRQSFLALRLAEYLRLDADHREVLYYSSLMAWVGCHVDAYEQAKWFGDDRALKHEIRWIDDGNPAEAAAFVLRHLGAGRPWVQRTRLAVGFVGDGRRVLEDLLDNHWRTADALMERLGLSREVRDSVAQTFERWDGKGQPDGARGTQIRLPSRLVNLADVVEVFHQAGGVNAAIAVARQRSGTQFDPSLVELFCEHAEQLFAELESVPSWEALMAAEPRLDRELAEDEFDAALAAVADFVDLKSPFTIGHSRAVADLARHAARHLEIGDQGVAAVTRAALLHDLGRLGVSNAIWDKTGPLTRVEVERVRLHPYLTERMLVSSPTLASLAPLAAQHHERLDGSGYPRGLSGESISPGGHVLAVADLYRSKIEPRPHRPAAAPDEAAVMLREEVRAGRLGGDVVDAVLVAAGHRAHRRRTWPAGLTGREVEVLRLVARGLSHKQIAETLVISRKTASNHVEHIYAKTGASNRAMAALFAVKHGIMRDDDLEPPATRPIARKYGERTP
jgi:HD-GYP domain-containing protein (c-di-GMP phosphodiesterase class II)